MDGSASRDEHGQAGIIAAAQSGDVTLKGINTRWVGANGRPTVDPLIDGAQFTIIGAPTSRSGRYLRPRQMNPAKQRSIALQVTR